MRHVIATIVASAMLAGTSFAAETAIAWGYNNHGQCNVPAGETFVQVAAGVYHSIGLRADGTAIAFGHNGHDQCNVPAGETFVQVAGGYRHTIGLREDGTAIAWGNNDYGQCDFPAGEAFVQVSCGQSHTIGLRADGTAIAWGNNVEGQCNVPAGESPLCRLLGATVTPSAFEQMARQSRGGRTITANATSLLVRPLCRLLLQPQSHHRPPRRRHGYRVGEQRRGPMQRPCW